MNERKYEKQEAPRDLAESVSFYQQAEEKQEANRDLAVVDSIPLVQAAGRVVRGVIRDRSKGEPVVILGSLPAGWSWRAAPSLGGGWAWSASSAYTGASLTGNAPEGADVAALIESLVAVMAGETWKDECAWMEGECTPS